MTRSLYELQLFDNDKRVPGKPHQWPGDMRCHADTFICNQDAPDNKFHGANIEPTWVLSAPDGPHFGPMNLDIRDSLRYVYTTSMLRHNIYLSLT